MPVGSLQNKLDKACVTLALSSLRAIALAEKRQALLEHAAKSADHMRDIVERLEIEKQKMRLIKEISPHLS